MPPTPFNSSPKRPQIVATLGPSSSTPEIIEKMVEAGLNLARLNMAWGSNEEHAYFIQTIRDIAARRAAPIPIVFDLSGPRIQETDGHHFASTSGSIITGKDREDIALGIHYNVDYFALSYVGSAGDVRELRDIIEEKGGKQRIIAKIARKVALENSQEILAEADAIMIARGDLANEVPLHEIPFHEIILVEAANAALKSVIVASGMMPSMIENARPSRSDVTDVAFAALIGADAVLLSSETTQGKFPVETISMMASILGEVVGRGYAGTCRPL